MNKNVDINLHQIRIRTINVQPENQYVDTVKRKETSPNYAKMNTENGMKVEYLRNPKRHKKAIPTSR